MTPPARVCSLKVKLWSGPPERLRCVRAVVPQPGAAAQVLSGRQRTYARSVDALTQLRLWLAEDRADGLPWEPERFAQAAWLAVREHGGGRLLLRAIVDTTPAWHDSYLGVNGGTLAQFSLDAFRDDADPF